MSDLVSAAQRLRDSVAALPEYARADQIIRTKPATWTYDDTGNVFATRYHGEVYRGPAAIGPGGFVAEAETNGIAAHIALVASPHVTEALERHLAAFAAFEAVLLEQARRGAAGLRDHEIAERMRQREKARDEIERTVHALAAAINHTGKD